MYSCQDAECLCRSMLVYILCGNVLWSLMESKTWTICLFRRWLAYFPLLFMRCRHRHTIHLTWAFTTIIIFGGFFLRQICSFNSNAGMQLADYYMGSLIQCRLSVECSFHEWERKRILLTFYALRNLRHPDLIRNIAEFNDEKFLDRSFFLSLAFAICNFYSLFSCSPFPFGCSSL